MLQTWPVCESQESCLQAKDEQATCQKTKSYPPAHRFSLKY